MNVKKFNLSKSSSRIINTIKSLKDRGLIKEIQNLSVQEARIEFSKIRAHFAYKKR